MRTSRRRRLGPWIAAFIVVSTLNNLFVLQSDDTQRLGALVQIMLLLALFALLIVLPSDATELERVLDTEAATATLGITFWTAWMYPMIAYGMDWAPEIAPGAMAAFIFVVYLLARGLVALKHR